MRFTSTILCVDDDEDDLYFIKEAIRSHQQSFEIAEAMNGQAAIEYLQESIQNGTLPCLIIMDVNMPKMNGRETIARIKSDPQMAVIPIAVFTTSSHAADRQYFEGHGIRFITKPFDFKLFTRQIQDLLNFCASLKS